jgi:hypothetical protein
MSKSPTEKSMDTTELSTTKVSKEEMEGIENALNLFIFLRDSGAILPTSYFEQIDFYDKHGDSKIRPKKVRQSYQQKVNEQKLAWLASEAKVFLSNSKLLDKRIDENALASRKKSLSKEFAKFTKDGLIEKFAILNFHLDQVNAELTAQKEINSYLSNHLMQDLSTQQEVGDNRTNGINKKFVSNNACMKVCLEEVLSSTPEEKWSTKGTYKKFCAHTKKRFPKPPNFKKQRQSKEEKLQDRKVQEIDLDATARKEWADSTLRDYFEKQMKLSVAKLQ